MSDATVSPIRRGRPPAGRERLSRSVIVDAAMSVIDDGGPEAVSMRTVARELGVDPKSLYNHVPGKEALLDAVVERVLARMVVPVPTGVLGDDILAIAREFRHAVLSNHPRAASLILARPIEALSTLEPLDAALSVLMNAGASPEDAVHAVRTMLAFMTGTLLREVDSAMTLASRSGSTAAARSEALANGGLPNVRAAAQYLADIDHKREFEYGLTLLVAAFEARLAR
ncbi:TetR/AcrR family transcriptional regulator C-terminal domain-containing protein [Rhodococcus sp. NPDC056743]|uniref:TetR/AcrR family transcriptional regulator C-terminal domain-containing protein n=1 Tax=Rhodococcus sp. NPDC056743 TaxID=3345934 RepID=UPI00367220A5